MITEANLKPQLTAAYRSCIRLLAFRARSIREIRIYLSKKGYPETILQETVSRLSLEGLLNDRDFAQAYVENKKRFSPRSRYALRYELNNLGIDGDISEAVLNTVDDFQSAYTAATLKLHNWNHLEPEVLKKKITGLLRRRGFSYDIIMTVYDTIASEIDTDS